MIAKEGHRYYKERTRLERVIPLATPFILYVDPSSVCNLQCNFCPCGRAHDDLWSDEKKNSIGFMKMSTFKKVVDDCTSFPDKIKVLRLYKEGEPLLNEHFPEMVAYAKESGNFIGIDTTTNGTLLNPKLNREIVKAGLTRIHISVEGLSDDEYYKVCNRKIDFDEFVSNIKDLYDHKGNCHVFVKTIIENCSKEDEIKRKKHFYDLFGNLCDEISFEHIAPCWPGFDKKLYSETVGIYGNKIQKCIVCPRLFYILTINSDGVATRCIVDWNRKMVIGNVFDHTVPELWKMMDRYRIEHLKGNRRKMVGCSECLEIETAALDNIDAYRATLLKRMEMRL